MGINLRTDRRVPGFTLKSAIEQGATMPFWLGLFVLSTAWAVTTGLALWSIRNRRIDQHRDWMLRGYVATFAFVSPSRSSRCTLRADPRQADGNRIAAHDEQ
jgi:Predicted membrane protein (DUF2306)